MLGIAVIDATDAGSANFCLTSSNSIDRWLWKLPIGLATV